MGYISQQLHCITRLWVHQEGSFPIGLVIPFVSAFNRGSLVNYIIQLVGTSDWGFPMGYVNMSNQDSHNVS